jgi:hypothetical protein
MNQQSFLSSDPRQAAVSWILENDNGRNTINWQTCECIWDSSNLVNPNAAEDEVRHEPDHHLPSLISQQVSVYGMKGYLTTPAGASRSFLIRHCYEFADPPTYYVQASVGTEPEVPAKLENFRLRPGHTEPVQAAFEDHVRELTQTFREQGIEKTAKWLFDRAQSRPQVNGLTNGH